MNIISPSRSHISKLCNYNSAIFPEKKIDSKRYLGFWSSFFKHSINDDLLLIDDNEEIHGQILSTPFDFYYKGAKHNSVWLFDLIVDENLRKTACGIDLLLECMEKHPNSCSTGSGPVALPIHLKLGNKMLGEIKKYVGIINPLYIASSIFRGNVAISKFLNEVSVNGHNFSKITIDQLPILTQPFNNNLWEVSRDIEFLKWRYFNDLHEYAFYKDYASNDFFVVRTIVQKQITMMLLVDYRCDASKPDSFERIMKAVFNIMNNVHIAFFMTGSTLKTFDDVLELHHMKSIGRPRPVIGFQKVKDRKADIEARNFAFVTLADSDGETNWI